MYNGRGGTVLMGAGKVGFILILSLSVKQVPLSGTINRQIMEVGIVAWLSLTHLTAKLMAIGLLGESRKAVK